MPSELWIVSVDMFVFVMLKENKDFIRSIVNWFSKIQGGGWAAISGFNVN